MISGNCGFAGDLSRSRELPADFRVLSGSARETPVTAWAAERQRLADRGARQPGAAPNRLRGERDSFDAAA